MAAAGTGLRAAPRDEAAARGAAYIADSQQSSGTFFSPDTSSDTAAEAVVALVAGGVDGEPVDRALPYIREHGPARADERAGYAGRIAMGIAAAGEDPRDFGGVDYAEKIRSHYDDATGNYDSNLYANALALLGLAAAGVEPPEEAIRYVRANQCADGGFSWAPGCAATADVDTTAHALGALLATGVSRDDLAVTRARDWLVRARNDEGGYGWGPGKPTNGNSTGLALSAIAALGEDPTAEPWADESGDPVTALLALQTPSGGFKYLASDDGPNDYATVQAAPGTAGAIYPVLPEAEEEPTPAPTAPGPSPDPTATPENRDEHARTPGPARAPPSNPDEPTADARGQAAPPSRPTRASPSPGRAPSEVFGSGEHRAGLVVRGEDDELRRMCVFFDADELTGLELLRRTDLDLDVGAFEGQGKAICRIGPDGCGDGEDCFCRYPTFWGYWVRDPSDDAWRFSELGASNRMVRDEAADAWIWGEDGEPAPPDDLDTEDLCPATAPETRAATAAPETTPEPEEGGVNTLALGGIGALLGGSGLALAIRRRWTA